MKTPLPDYKLRLPQALKDSISAAATANNRSMNAEMVARLEASFQSDEATARGLKAIAKTAKGNTIVHLEKELAELKRVVVALAAKVG